METDLKIFDTVDSTNDTLKELAENGAPEGTCVLAFCQLKGHGRSGRSFYSPDGGNLYMSLLLRPGDPKSFDMITVTAAVAVVSAIKETFSADTGIKWVNDIYHDGKKVCGIIATAYNVGTKDVYIILGIGVNIYKSSHIPEDIKGIYGSLFPEEIDLSESARRDSAIALCKSIIKNFSYYYDRCLYKDVISLYRKYCIVIGKKVEYLSGERTVAAKVVDIDDKGHIVLDENGIIKTYGDGEIRIIPADENLA